jgi:hypothetical protein
LDQVNHYQCRDARKFLVSDFKFPVDCSREPETRKTENDKLPGATPC